MERRRRSRSTGSTRRVLLALAAVALLLAGGPRDAARAADARGRLVVEIGTRRSDGEEFLLPGTTVWIYYDGAADRHVKHDYGHGLWSGYITKHLLARRDVGRAPAASLAPATQALPGGEYYVSLVATSGDVATPFMLGCGAKVSVTAGHETRVKFPYTWRDSTGARRECDWSRGSYARAAAAAPLDRNPWLAAWDDVKAARERCARVAAPMLTLRERVVASPPSTPAVRVFSWEGENQETVAGGGEQEIDAAQVRLIVEALKYRCWSELYHDGKWRLPAATSDDEREIEANIRALVHAELRKLDQINVIATILEDVERRQPR